MIYLRLQYYKAIHDRDLSAVKEVKFEAEFMYDVYLSLLEDQTLKIPDKNIGKFKLNSENCWPCIKFLLIYAAFAYFT